MSLDFDKKRERMVTEQLVPRGITDPLTLEAMRTVPRHRFVSPDLVPFAYEDGPLPIAEGQTISQPYIVAIMTQAGEIQPTSNVLEIGTGSGYAAAVLAHIAKQVYTVERIPSLAEGAKLRYQDLGYTNVSVKIANGTIGWPEKGPFDAILVTAGSPDVPESLLKQLAPGGRLVIPVGDRYSQRLIRLRKSLEGEIQREVLDYVRFVPLIGEEGWPE